MDAVVVDLWAGRGSLEGTLRRMRRTQIDRPIEAKDASGSIEILISAAGLVERVAIDEAWREHYEPADLSGAILAAYQSAAARTTGWATSDGAAAAAASEPQGKGPVASGHSRAAQRLRVRPLAEYPGCSSSGCVQAMVGIGGNLVAVRIDPDWLTHRPAFSIARELLEAINDAGQRAALATSTRPRVGNHARERAVAL
mgnify:FL=1